MAKQGFITINRKITSWEWWTNCITRGLFLYMIINANWNDGYFQGQLVRRGQFITSYNKLAEENGLNRKTVMSHIKRLVSTGEITVKSTKRWTTVTVVNYAKYQDLAKIDGPQDGLPDGPLDGPQDGLNITINNKKNKKTRKRESNTPTIEEVAAYCSERQNGIDPNRFTNYYEARGWLLGNGVPMKDWKATIRSWEKRQDNNRKEKVPGYLTETSTNDKKKATKENIKQLKEKIGKRDT